MERISGIYCIQNKLDGKRYIGQSVDIYARWRQHKWHLNNNRHSNYHLQASWIQNGEENFQFDILKQCEIQELDKLEIYFIDKYKTFNNKYGYNFETGGSLHKKRSYESVEKVALANRKPVNQYHRNGEYVATYSSIKEASQITGISFKYISSACLGKTKVTGGFQWRFVNDTSPVQDLSNIENKHNKCVAQYDLSGNLITIYNSLTEAGVKNQISYKGISNACRGVNKTAGGYQWRYTKDEKSAVLKIQSCNYNLRDGHLKPISQYAFDGLFIKEYASISEAARQTGIRYTGIYGACKRQKPTAGGFQWRYSEEKIKKCEPLTTKNRPKVVFQFSLDGKFVATYNSASEAERQTGISQCTIRDACMGKQLTSGGYQWKYAEDNIKKCKKVEAPKSPKPVYQYDKENTFIKKYNNAKCAEKETNICNDSITKVCRKQQKTAGGYIWKYEEVS